MLLPRIEKITRDVTIVHFFTMFGYKLFSLYFPLFLVARGFSLPEVGYAYLLIYLPIALLAPPVSFLNHKINPAVLTSIGILGYGVYALGMILIPPAGSGEWLVLFYLWQILLGVSAALFFASSRAILMGSSLENPDRAFGWFYSAPFYAAVVAPVVGAAFIWKFDFAGVFILSLAIHFFNVIFCFIRLRVPARVLPDHGFNLKTAQENYREVFQKLKERTIFSLVLVSFGVLLLGGFYRAFLVLFLKQELAWSQNLILLFGAIFSFIFMPVSLAIIKKLEIQKSSKNVFQGGILVGTFSILFGIMMPVFNFLSLLLVNIGRSIGALMANSGRSGLINRELKKYPEEAGAIDTIFVPLGTAVGSFAGGMLVGVLGFAPLFIFGGIFVLIIVVLGKVFTPPSMRSKNTSLGRKGAASI